MRCFSSCLPEKATIEAPKASVTESHALLFQISLLSTLSSIGSQFAWIKKLPPAKKKTGKEAAVVASWDKSVKKFVKAGSEENKAFISKVEVDKKERAERVSSLNRTFFCLISQLEAEVKAKAEEEKDKEEAPKVEEENGKNCMDHENPRAVEYLQRDSGLNKLDRKIKGCLSW